MGTAVRLVWVRWGVGGEDRAAGGRQLARIFVFASDPLPSRTTDAHAHRLTPSFILVDCSFSIFYIKGGVIVL